ncbi:uncharacterized protein LOC113215046 isoform X2 [Frankliniella occidentalis]|uniref:Uncharacterized protein LOC113215046 isoform X2 n=1 Tax=Frankliniella occidentalis TaxID=133901 RepID=A0A6J1T9Z4_FRAOC|nr:uncharacterized protein LOC113215046 isoform X2 [Frankliniella occidentalis]
MASFTHAITALALLATQYFTVEAAKFTIVNRCPYKVWPATGGAPWEGWALEPQQSIDVYRDAGWSGRFWARTECNFNQAGEGGCKTGDCNGLSCRAGGAPPASLAEFTLAGFGGMDFYDVSLVDGFNIPVSVRSQGGSGSCRETSCKFNINSVCPPELQDKGGAACKSACLAFGDPKYCCTGDFNDPNRCKPTHYSELFHNHCPDAYSYAYDDLRATFTCSRADYTITFCP